MSSRSSIAPIQPPKASQTAYVAVIWTGASVTFCFVVFRLFVRITRFRRLFIDDVFVILAWLMLLCAAILSQVTVSRMFLFISFASGRLRMLPPPDFFDRATMYLHYQTAIQLLYLSGLWCIKFAFLFFFRTLSQGLKRERILWWAVFTLTLLTYFCVIGTFPYSCTTGTVLQAAIRCNSAPRVRYLIFNLQFNTTVNVVTDVLILCIPIHILWKVRMSLRRKLVLGGIFSLTVIIILFSILRATLTSSTSDARRLQPEQTWMFLWGYIEASIALIVSCLASFRTLFTKSERPSNPRSPNRGKDLEANGSPDIGSPRSPEFKVDREKLSLSEGGCNKTSIHAGTESPQSPTTPISSSSMSSLSSDSIILLPDSVHFKHGLSLLQVHIEPPELQWEHSGWEAK